MVEARGGAARARREGDRVPARVLPEKLVESAHVAPGADRVGAALRDRVALIALAAEARDLLVEQSFAARRVLLARHEAHAGPG